MHDRENCELIICFRNNIKMKHLAAYLLLTLGGNTSPKAKDIKAVLESVGIEADDERLSSLLSELEGKDINTVRAVFGSNYRIHAYTFVVDLGGCRQIGFCSIRWIGWWCGISCCRWCCRWRCPCRGEGGGEEGRGYVS
jgi:hypothetical protein